MAIGFTCSKHDAFGIGTDHCALCEAERDPVGMMRTAGWVAGRSGSFSEVELDFQRWAATRRTAMAVGFSGVVPNAWRDAWLDGYRSAVAERRSVQNIPIP
jgi:hypothetical protein